MCPSEETADSGWSPTGPLRHLDRRIFSPVILVLGDSTPCGRKSLEPIDDC